MHCYLALFFLYFCDSVNRRFFCVLADLLWATFASFPPPTFGWFFICRLFFTRFDFFSDFKCIQYQTITYVNTFLSNFVVVIKFQKHLALSRITLCFDSALSTISKVEHIFANLQTTFPTGYVIKYIKMCSKK